MAGPGGVRPGPVRQGRRGTVRRGMARCGEAGAVMGNPEHYGKRHQRLRAELIASGTWVGVPCFYCKKLMWPGQRLDLAHADDDQGRSVPGKYVGLVHAWCNHSAGGSVNPWGIRARAAAARDARSPERRKQLTDREARKDRKRLRSEFDAAQGDKGRDWG